MEIKDKLGLDDWYMVLLYIGIAIGFSCFAFEIHFVNKKHLLGLAIGLFIVGLSTKIAERWAYTRDFGVLYRSKVIKHNIGSIVFLLIGLGLTFFFGFSLIKSLI